jgi:hypothetical protein
MDNTTKLFIIADNAKNCGDYETANAIFAYLWAERPDGVQVGYEYLPDFDGEDEFLPGEGIPTGRFTQADIQDGQYHGLPFLAYRGMRLCIPAPLLDASAFNDFIKAVHRKKDSLGFQERAAHNRQTLTDEQIAALLPCQRVSLRDIHKYVPDFRVPDGILNYYTEYENPWRIIGMRPAKGLPVEKIVP